MSGHRAAELLLSSASVYRWAGRKVGLGRPFFMTRNDTHGGADIVIRPYPGTTKTEYVKIKEETKHGKPGNDPHSAEGL